MTEPETTRTDRSRAAVFIAVVAVVVLAIVGIRLIAGDDGGDARTDSLPSIELTGPDEAVVSTDDLVGQPLVVNFWYAACPPCANELGYFAAIDEEYGDQVRFVGVNAIDTVEEMTEFAGERGVSYELYQDPLAELQTEMRLTSFPTTLFVDADGDVVARTGVLDEAALEAEVLELLALSDG